MTERAKTLMDELFDEMTGGKSVAPVGPPTGITRKNLDGLRGGLAAIVATATFEQEYTTPDVLECGDEFFRELHTAELNLGTPGEPMSWQQVREVYRTWLTMAITALTPAGIACRINAMNAKRLANVATPAANAAKAEVPKTVFTRPTDAQLSS